MVVVDVVDVVDKSDDAVSDDGKTKARLSRLFSLQTVSVSFSINDANSLFISSVYT